MDSEVDKMQNFYSTISAVNSFSLTSNTENKYAKMKKLIAAIEIYLETRADDQIIVINPHLQALSLAIDLSIFDPHTNIAGKFFISVYDLMNILEPRSLTSWYCIDMLLNACKNSAARQALVTTYQFLPCLARMVGDQLTTEKKLILLRFMQDITCGIKISWQIPQMAHLLSMLCKWIERQETEIVTPSLGVLVNLCHKNVSSVYILQRNVDLKKFIRICLALKGPIVEVYVCQVSIILEDVAGYVPPLIFSKFIDSTFSALLEIYRHKDSISLKQVVEFFMEYTRNNNSSLVTEYNKYVEKIDVILEVMETSSSDSFRDPECLAIVLEFLNFLIEAKVPQMAALYPKIIALALNWIQEKTVSYQALVVLKSIANKVDKKDNQILESLIGGLKVFMLILGCCKDETMMAHTEYIKRLGALLQLLKAIVQVKSISSKVSQELHEDHFKNIFFPLLGDDSPRSSEITCSIDTVNLYVYALALVAKLLDCNNNWLGLLNSLLTNRQIHVVIAQAICHSASDVKQLALELSNSCSKEVSFALANLQSIMPSAEDSSNQITSQAQSSDLAFSFVAVGQQERLNILLEKVENSITKNEIGNLATSELMELYNYKLSYLSQSERAALSSVEASTKHCTHLQHRITRLTYEHNRLQQSEFHLTQKLEEMTKKKQELSAELNILQNKFEGEKGRFKALHSQFATKQKALEELEVAFKDRESKLSKTTQLCNKLEENCRRHEKNDQKKEELLKNANETIKNLTMQVNEMEKSLKDKDKQLKDTTDMLRLKASILESITKMANSQSLVS